MKKEYLNDTLHCTFASMISRYFVYSSSQHFTYAYPILFSSVSGCLLHKSLITNWMYVKHITKKKIVRYNGLITINEIKNSICLTVFIMFCYFFVSCILLFVQSHQPSIPVPSNFSTHSS